jgi:transcriptional regulator
MYMPAHFQETDLSRLHDFIEAHALGTLVIAPGGELQADHLPFLLDRSQGAQGTLLAHVARANDLWRKAAADVLDCLIVFQGPSAYISPNWYPSKQVAHEVVPTYNYATVHAHGRIVVHEDARWVRGLVGRLTRRFEADQPVLWKMGDAPPAYIAAMLENIVGLEIRIDRLYGKWKMSQNRTHADRAGAVSGLTAQGGEQARVVGQLITQLQIAAAPMPTRDDDILP